MKNVLANSTLKIRRGASEYGLQFRIGALQRERDALYEEVRQLRAAVQIYSEVVRRLETARSGRAA